MPDYRIEDLLLEMDPDFDKRLNELLKKLKSGSKTHPNIEEEFDEEKEKERYREDMDRFCPKREGDDTCRKMPRTCSRNSSKSRKKR